MNYELLDKLAVCLALYFAMAIPAWILLYGSFSVLALIARGPKYAKIVLDFPLRKLSMPEYISYDGDQLNVTEKIAIAIMLWPFKVIARGVSLTRSFVKLLKRKP